MLSAKPCDYREAKALKPSQLTAVVVDTTVQPKKVAHPTDASRQSR